MNSDQPARGAAARPSPVPGCDRNLAPARKTAAAASLTIGPAAPGGPSMSSTGDQPPSPTGLFRPWRRLYGAVLVVAVLTYGLLFLFSRAFAP